LIIFDESAFYAGYLSRIGDVFADLVPADRFPDYLVSATMALLANNGSKANVDYFMDVLTDLCKAPRETLWRRFLHFYATEYDGLEKITSLPAGLNDVFAFLEPPDYKLALATNPIFPLSVQHKRLAWAGLQHIPFDLITHIENMSFCKPHLGYYHEVCTMIDEPPEACLMVGNDPINDMVAANIGIKTYFTTDDKDLGQGDLHVSANLRAHSVPDVPEPDFSGPLKGLIKVLEMLQTSK
jgi:FMN phosphatase YigB (HAD superfamily)